jgi:hypothetical protein
MKIDVQWGGSEENDNSFERGQAEGTKKKKLIVAKPYTHLDIDKKARFRDGIVVKHSVTLQGEGLKHNVIINFNDSKWTGYRFAGS